MKENTNQPNTESVKVKTFEVEVQYERVMTYPIVAVSCRASSFVNTQMAFHQQIKEYQSANVIHVGYLIHKDEKFHVVAGNIQQNSGAVRCEVVIPNEIIVEIKLLEISEKEIPVPGEYVSKWEWNENKPNTESSEKSEDDSRTQQPKNPNPK